MEFNSIQYVTGGFTLAAFIAVCVMVVLLRTIDRQRNLLEAAQVGSLSPDQRELLQAILSQPDPILAGFAGKIDSSEALRAAKQYLDDRRKGRRDLLLTLCLLTVCFFVLVAYVTTVVIPHVTTVVTSPRKTERVLVAGTIIDPAPLPAEVEKRTRITLLGAGSTAFAIVDAQGYFQIDGPYPEPPLQNPKVALSQNGVDCKFDVKLESRVWFELRRDAKDGTAVCAASGAADSPPPVQDKPAAPTSAAAKSTPHSIPPHPCSSLCMTQAMGAWQQSGNGLTGGGEVQVSVTDAGVATIFKNGEQVASATLKNCGPCTGKTRQ